VLSRFNPQTDVVQNDFLSAGDLNISQLYKCVGRR
jgi:hypothetical protein